jgi:hypothetical protein
MAIGISEASSSRWPCVVGHCRRSWKIPKDRAAIMMITCTEEQALEMEAWLRIAARQYRNAEADLYFKCAALIARIRAGDG